MAGSRLYAPADPSTRVVDKIAYCADSLKVGSPFDPNVHIGPLVSQEQRERVLGYIECGVVRRRGGGAGGEAPGRTPATSSSRRSSPRRADRMRVVREEIFGPVLVAMPYEISTT